MENAPIWFALSEVGLTNVLFLLVVLFGIGAQLTGLGILVRFRMTPIRALKVQDELPGVSIVKTCFKSEDNEEENFDSFFKQDYPGKIQLLFVVSDESDPIVPLINQYLSKYPAVDAQLVVSRTRKAFWKKIDALYDSHREVKHEIVIWSDSDVIVEHNYVTQMVACMQEPGVSVVTTPQYDTRANTIASAFKVLGNNCDIATFMMIYEGWSKEKNKGFGQSLGFRKAEFDSFGEKAWATMNSFLADDQALPYIFWQHGRKVVFRNIYCPVEFSNKTFVDVIRQKYRWLVPQKMAIGNRYTFLAGALCYPVLISAIWMVATGFDSIPLKFFVLSCLLRIFVSFVFEALMLRQIAMTVKYFWVIPLWDLSHAIFFILGFFKNSMKFGNRVFRVVNRYYLEEVSDTSDPLEGPAKEDQLART